MAAQKTPGPAQADAQAARPADRPPLEERFARLASRVDELERRLFEIEGMVTPPVSE
jgi:hypothetical protein